MAAVSVGEYRSRAYCRRCECDHDWNLYNCNADARDRPAPGRCSEVFRRFMYNETNRMQPTHYCVPPIDVTEFDRGSVRMTREYRAALYTRNPLLDTEEVVGSFHGENPRVPSFAEFARTQAAENNGTAGMAVPYPLDDGTSTMASASMFLIEPAYECAEKMHAAMMKKRAKWEELRRKFLMKIGEECRLAHADGKTGFLARSGFLEALVAENTKTVGSYIHRKLMCENSSARARARVAARAQAEVDTHVEMLLSDLVYDPSVPSGRALAEVLFGNGPEAPAVTKIETDFDNHEECSSTFERLRESGGCRVADASASAAWGSTIETGGDPWLIYVTWELQ